MIHFTICCLLPTIFLSQSLSYANSVLHVQNLAKWLVTEQPITLAVNEDVTSSNERSFAVAKELFENTSQVKCVLVLTMYCRS